MSNQFTPGPWRINSILIEESRSIIARDPQSGRDVRVADIPDCVDAESEANARFIAAAPALYEALMLALPYVETALEDQGYKPGVVDRMTKTIRAALALVEGEPINFPLESPPLQSLSEASNADECHDACEPPGWYQQGLRSGNA